MLLKCTHEQTSKTPWDKVLPENIFLLKKQMVKYFWKKEKLYCSGFKNIVKVYDKSWKNHLTYFKIA